MEFLVPLHLADLELPKAERYHVHNVHAFDDVNDKEVASRLRKLEQHVLSTTDAGLELLQEECLDFCYSLVKKLPGFSEAIQLRIVEVLTAFVSNVTDGVTTIERSNEPDEIAQYRSAFKVSVYFLIMTLTALSHQLLQQEKDIVAKGGGDGDPSAHEIDCDGNVWAVEDESPGRVLYSKVVFQLLENTALCRSKTLKPMMYHLVGKSLQKVPSIHISVVTSLVELIYAHEHLSGWVADMVELLYFKYENLVFAADLISEIGKTSSRDASKDTIGTKNISTFLSNLSTLTPYLIMENLSFVLALLDSESYQLRNASVTCITQILLWNFRQKGSQLDQERETTVEKEKQSRKKTRSRKNRGDDDDDDGSEATESDNEDDDAAPVAVADRGSARRDLSRSTRDQLLDVLEDRMHDVNSFARSHVLKMWFLLCEEGALPIHMLKRVTLIAVGRLQDKAAVVRRHSMHLLTLLLESNPFMGNLERDSYSVKRDELLEELKKKREEMIAFAEKEVQAAMGDVQIGEDDADGENNGESDEQQKAKVEQEVKTMARLLQFYEDAMSFIDEFELKALPLITQLLGSKSVSDVLEAIQFFEKAYRFHLQAAYSGIKKMLTLIWRADPSVHDQLLNTFAALFIQINTGDADRQSPEVIAENLVKFLDECTVAEYTCLEKIVGELHQKRLIPMSVINALWDFVDETSFPAAVLGNALSMLSMIASVDRAMLLSNDRLSQIYANGFGDVSCKTDTSTRVLSAACRLIQCLHLDSKAAENASIRQRIQRVNLETIEQIVARLQGFLVLDFVPKGEMQIVSSQSAWFDTAQQTIEAIFSICEQPEEICGEVVRHLAQHLFQDEDEDTISIFELAHFLFVVGHVAVKVAVHIEKLATSVKKLRVRHEEKLNKRAGSMDEASGQANNDPEDVSAMEDELGVAAEVEAEEDMYVQNMTQKEIVCRNLLGTYGPLIIRVLRGGNDEISGDELLIECAVVALSKFMAVSDEFCEKHLQLLFTILQESPLPSVRGDVIIALGDLSYRYPNLIEPWTTHLYNRLRDVDLNVRKNTIVVLSHLILNDMIKVKAQISEIAISLVDEEEGIRNMTKLFFHELSKKGTNPIYNMLPDAIGQLSSSELVSNENFESISRFLIQFLTKEKQIESIVEKLCQRFPSAVKVKHQRDLAFCLAQLPHTEKSLRYLLQNRKLLRDALTDSGVTKHFAHLVNKARRGNIASATTAEMKDAIDQLDKLVERAENGEEEDEDAAVTVDGGVSSSSGAPREPATPKPKGKTRRGSKKVVQRESPKAKRTPRPKRKTRAQVVESSASSSEDE
ncbi:Condensin complex subunit, partial [Globisporangium splendens]